MPGRAAAATPGQGTGAASSLALAAELVASDDPPRVIVVHGLGDFDTHQGEAQRHPALMEQLDAGIETFFTTLDARGAAGVKGGRHGERPSLTDVDDNGNLKHSVDFRSLYATLLDGWLGADPVEILGKGHEPLPLFSTEPARSSPPNRQG